MYKCDVGGAIGIGVTCPDWNKEKSCCVLMERTRGDGECNYLQVVEEEIVFELIPFVLSTKSKGKDFTLTLAQGSNLVDAITEQTYLILFFEGDTSAELVTRRLKVINFFDPIPEGYEYVITEKVEVDRGLPFQLWYLGPE